MKSADRVWYPPAGEEFRAGEGLIDIGSKIAVEYQESLKQVQPSSWRRSNGTVGNFWTPSGLAQHISRTDSDFLKLWDASCVKLL